MTSHNTWQQVLYLFASYCIEIFAFSGLLLQLILATTNTFLPQLSAKFLMIQLLSLSVLLSISVLESNTDSHARQL